MPRQVLHERWYEAVAGRRVICPNRGRAMAAEECLACTALVAMVLDGDSTYVRCSDVHADEPAVAELPTRFAPRPPRPADEPDADLLVE